MKNCCYCKSLDHTDFKLKKKKLVECWNWHEEYEDGAEKIKINKKHLLRKRLIEAYSAICYADIQLVS